MVVFEEDMCKEAVVEQPVDLEYHGRLSKRLEKKLIIFERQHTQYNQ